MTDNLRLTGGGLWHPEAAPVAAIRRDIDQRPRHLKDTLLEDGMRKHFLGGAPKNDARIVKAFVASNKDNALKTRPKVSYALPSLHRSLIYRDSVVCCKAVA